ncbi:MAG: hypothetical protein HYZ44_16515 [Bacteroidetes bacterium]|nr:hypothetical protein [Bacteroidota bacterium]
MSLLARFIFTATGAFVIWMFKGFNGTFNQEMFYMEERNSKMAFLQLVLGVGIWTLAIMVIGVLLSRYYQT